MQDSGGECVVESGSPPAIERPSVPADVSAQRRQEEKQQRRALRMSGRLTELRMCDIVGESRRGVPPDYREPGVVSVLRGRVSQFDAGRRAVSAMPEATSDCCQTFSTLAAVIVASMGVMVLAEECWTQPFLHWLLYAAAWLHQLTRPVWPRRGARPTVGDLNAALHLREFFPAHAADEAFEVVFYNEADKARSLLQKMCVTQRDARKRAREHRDAGLPAPSPECGYIIVSGEYTVSVFVLDNDVRSKQNIEHAWTLFIADSHGTFPWAGGKANISSVRTALYRTEAAAAAAPSKCLPFAAGINHFADILFTLLEDNRSTASRAAGAAASIDGPVPYMTWTPLRRVRSDFLAAEDIRELIDQRWLPRVLADPVVSEQHKARDSVNLNCFWGSTAPPAESPAALPTPPKAPTHQTKLTSFVGEVVTVVTESQAVAAPPPTLVPTKVRPLSSAVLGASRPKPLSLARK